MTTLQSGYWNFTHCQNSPNQDYTHPDDRIPPTYVMTPNHSQYEYKGKYIRPVPKEPLMAWLLNATTFRKRLLNVVNLGGCFVIREIQL